MKREGPQLAMHLEVNDGTKWLHYAAPYVNDNPYLEALLGYKRNREPEGSAPWMGIEPLFAEMGLPTDLSEVTLKGFELDAHDGIFGTSYIGRKDISKLRMALANEEITKAGKAGDAPSLEEILHVQVDRGGIDVPMMWEDVRIVYWFVDAE